MKKTILLFLSVAMALAGMAQGIYNSGASMVSESGNYVVVSNGNFTLTSQSASYPASFANLKIEESASLTIEPKSFVTVSGTLATHASDNDGLVLSSTADGTGSLLHTTAGVNATINRYITGSTNINALTYHFVSIPLTAATNSTQNLFLGSYLYDFDVATNSWHGLGNSTSNTMDEAKGYMVYSPVAEHTYQFAGPINAGTFSPLVTFAGQGNNLVPNPYPSAIDWDAVSGWTKTNIAASVYVWPSGGSNYATYVNGIPDNEGSNIIPAGQAFIVMADDASPSLTMTDAVRVHDGHSFFKANETIRDLLRIKATSNAMCDEAVVRFSDLATTNADGDYDAWKLYGSDGAPQLYTVAADNEMLAINSLPYTSAAYTVPMNFEQKSTCEVSFVFSKAESFDPAISIHLQDLKANKTINIREQDTYTFNHTEGNDAKRFKIIFGGAIGVGETPAEISRLWISDNMLYINKPDCTGEMALLNIYSMTGQLLMQKSFALTTLTSINLGALPSVAVVARVTVNGKILITKGIIVR